MLSSDSDQKQYSVKYLTNKQKHKPNIHITVSPGDCEERSLFSQLNQIKDNTGGGKKCLLS